MILPSHHGHLRTRQAFLTPYSLARRHPFCFGLHTSRSQLSSCLIPSLLLNTHRLDGYSPLKSSSMTTNPLGFPSWNIPGDNAWQLTAASLVGLQSIPGLAVMYAGLVKKKWAINSAFMVFYAFSCILIVWVIWGYKMGMRSNASTL